MTDALSVARGVAVAFLFLGAWLFVMACVGVGIVKLAFEKYGDHWWGFPLYMALGFPSFALTIAGVLFLGLYGFDLGAGAHLR